MKQKNKSAWEIAAEEHFQKAYEHIQQQLNYDIERMRLDKKIEGLLEEKEDE